MRVPGAQSGSAPPLSMTSRTRSTRRLPILPAGWFIAYSSCVSRLACAWGHTRVGNTALQPEARHPGSHCLSMIDMHSPACRRILQCVHVQSLSAMQAV